MDLFAYLAHVTFREQTRKNYNYVVRTNALEISLTVTGLAHARGILKCHDDARAGFLKVRTANDSPLPIRIPLKVCLRDNSYPTTLGEHFDR